MSMHSMPPILDVGYTTQGSDLYTICSLGLDKILLDVSGTRKLVGSAEVADYADAAFAMTELQPGHWVAGFSGLPVGSYTFVVYKQAGVSPAPTTDLVLKVVGVQVTANGNFVVN